MSAGQISAAPRRALPLEPVRDSRWIDRRPVRLLVAALVALGVVVGIAVTAQAAQAAPGCTTNAIVCENALPGTPADQWDINGVGDSTIQGFATQMSVDLGERIDFKIDTDASAYGIQIFRLGYYGGLGARKIADVSPSATLPQTQPACATDATTEIYDCGTWGVSASWNVPTDVVSGVYLAVLTRTDTGGRSQIPFVVRNDASRSDAVFQTSDASWQAYNMYGGSDFYAGKANGRAYKVSYNRPFITRGSDSGRDYLFANEYPMLRFLERNGYDLSYISSLDTDIRGADLKKHKIFISTGHDEYWSQGQRDSVEAARDAGVNLAFFSGNEVYWRTRWEPSQDGSNTANRTLVCYKDTWADSPLDPTGPTSTWRDARGASDPENGLTGTIYKANDSDLALTVSGAEGKLRLWRNTGLGDVADTATTTLAKHTVGYESDEDLDNGYRPAGLFRLSTTVGKTPQYLTDFGRTVVAGTTTHSLTMYKASSGALVFGAGTVQWAWGLDTNHDGVTEPVDVRMQQAMINLFADMSAQPASLSTPGLVAASKSTDTTAPTASIVTPAVTTALQQGTSITVAGTATDVGGKVAGVEVSLDGGTSWHPATGRTAWTYTGVLTGNGANAVRARAVDDSGNLQSAVTTLATAVSCPCSLFGTAVPGTAAVTDSAALNLGVRFTAASDGFVTGIRFYKGAGNTGTHTGTLYAADGTVLNSVTFTDETDTGWQTATFAQAVAVTAGTTYVAAYTAPSGHYAADSWYFGYSGITAGVLSAAGGKASSNGVWGAGTAFPNNTYKQTNYYADVVFSLTDPTPLTALAAAPVAGSGSVPVTTAVTAKLTRDAVAGTVALTLKSAAGQNITGTLGFDAATRTVTFTPAAPLAYGTSYTVSVSATPVVSGIVTKAANWSFTTARAPQVAGVCPCSLYDETDTPSVVSVNDTDSVELGTAFSSDTSGQITGVEFYKGAGNTGSHTVSLWTTDGELLATAAVTSETTLGWQVASFDQPVAIKAGTTYIASYRSPKGGYSYTAGAYAAATDRAPLHTTAGAGRYGYGKGAPLSGSNASYYVDPVFTVGKASLPQVASVNPASKSTSVPVSAAVTVTFDSSIQANTAAIVVTDAAGTAVAGTTANAVGASATFTPTAPFAAGTKYTVTVSGAKNLGGAAMTDPSSTTFTTSGPSACPCMLLASSAKPAVGDSGDAGAITVGTRFTSSVDGYVRGLRYWRNSAGGATSGALFTASGTKLADLTIGDADAGWQQIAFDSPVAITAGTEYVVAVFLPQGHYAYTAGMFSQPYANLPLTGTQGLYAVGANTFPTASYRGTFYGVDPVFALTADSTAPKISAVKVVAADGKATITWTTDEASSSEVSYGTSADQLDGTATGAGDVTAHSVTVSGLSVGKTYAFTVGSRDAAGNADTTDADTFTVADATAPVISAVSVSSSGGSATITWTTDESATGSVAYGTSADKLSSSLDESGTGTSHSVKITGLTVGTTYSYRITSADKAGNTTVSPAKSATAASWTQQPIVVLKTINDTDGSLSYSGLWKRSSKRGYGDYNDDVTYTNTNGASLSYAFTGVSVALVTEMFSDQGQISVSIDGGAAKTIDTTSSARKVQQTVFTSGDLGNGKHTIKITKLSGTNMLIDALVVGTVDTTAPVITAITASGTGSTAKISWKTDEASSTVVAYGTSAGSLTSSATGDTSTADHSVNLTGLTAGTTYSYKVTSVDTNGNATTSPVGTFTPVIPPKTVNDDDSAISYGAGWQRSSGRGLGDLKDDVTYTMNNGASATYTFTGTAVTLITEKYSDMGYAQISVDGGSAKLVNLASSSRQVQQAVFSATGLSSGKHTIKITKASGTYLLIDGFTITPTA